MKTNITFSVDVELRKALDEHAEKGKLSEYLIGLIKKILPLIGLT